MATNIFNAGKLVILAFLVTQLGTTVRSSPVAEPAYINDLVKRTCTYPLKFGSPTNQFALLSYISIANTGTPLSISGNIGVSPSGTISGIPAASVTGTIYINTPSAASALATASARCSCAAAALPRTTVPGTSITGMTFTPGNYFFAGAVNLAASGSVTFDAGGNVNAQFIVIITGAFTTGASSTILLINGAKACNIFWTVGTPTVNAAATLGASSIVYGNGCVWGAITMGAGVTVTGLWVTLVNAAASTLAIDGGTFKIPIC